MELVKVATRFHERLIHAGPGVFCGRHTRFALFFARLQAEIPRLPIIDVGPRLVEHDAAVAPHCAVKFIVKARSEHRPLASVGMPNDPDAIGIHIVHLRERRVAIRGDVSQK